MRMKKSDKPQTLPRRPGRPPKPSGLLAVSVPFRLPRGLLRALAKYAKKHGKTQRECAEQAIKTLIDER